MGFDDIIGNEQVKHALVGMADSGRVPHAVMFYENDGAGALAISMAFLQYLNCGSRNGDACGECISCKQVSRYIHPDIIFSFPIATGSKVSGKTDSLTSEEFLPYWRELAVSNPYFLESELNTALGVEGKSVAITAAESRHIISKLSIASVTDGYRAVIMMLPEKMNVNASNRLLKIIEEPSEKTIFILITHSIETVLPTISSRCQGIRLLPLTRDEVKRYLVEKKGVDPVLAETAASYSEGSIGKALHYIAGRAETVVYENLFRQAMEAVSGRNYMAALVVGESLAALDSREKQKAFCTFAGESIRKMFMLRNSMETIAGLTPDEYVWMEELARKAKPTFFRKASEALDKAMGMIERNVSQKIIFCNLMNRLYLLY